jgi:hypothetical protein
MRSQRSTERSPWAPLFFALALALAVWLRGYGITQQVVIDDEWHALHKLMGASYREIFASFGVADHSIPLTLFYKAMADTVGLAEGRLRLPQIACGIALVPAGAWLAWRVTRDAAAAALFAFFLAGAPFLVMWSRFARPYAITLLLTIACIAAIWRWRVRRSRGLAVAAALTAALSTWLHPISGLYAATACMFVFVEDALVARGAEPRAWRASLRLGAAVAASMAALIAVPLYGDAHSLSVKAGGDRPDLAAIERMLAIIWGGIPTVAVFGACVLAGWGFVVLHRRDARLSLYLLMLGFVPGLVLFATGAVWMQTGQNFLRYQLPLEPLVLFFGSVGMVSAVRRLARAPATVWMGVALIVGAYLAASPAISQVATLGPWYAHPEHHWDYRHRWMEHFDGLEDRRPPAFYTTTLAALPKGETLVIEAPFVWEGFLDRYANYARFHEQRERFGLLHDLCLEGPYVGEIPPGDRRFRFRSFIFLQDVEAVRASGARYLLLDRQPPKQVGPAYDAARCLAKLSALYGPPAQIDPRLAVFDLGARGAPKALKLQ